MQKQSYPSEKNTDQTEMNDKNKTIRVIAILIAFIGTYIFFIKILFF
jgi:hypothetical protein